MGGVLGFFMVRDDCYYFLLLCISVTGVATGSRGTTSNWDVRMVPNLTPDSANSIALPVIKNVSLLDASVRMMAFV